MSNEIATLNTQMPMAVATLESYTMSVDSILARKGVLNAVMKKVMIEKEHYGTIPGCGNKPTLLKPGAEAIASTFQLCPRYQISKTEIGNGHREYEIVCELFNPAGGFVGAGVGSATTMEGKYRFRQDVVPDAQVSQKYWDSRDPAMLGGPNRKPQKRDGKWVVVERVEHDNPADYYNTVLKMAKKRAFVDAVLTATGASDIFTQDIEDMPEVIPQVQPQAATTAQAKPSPDAAQPKKYNSPSQPQHQGGERPQATAQQVNAIRAIAKTSGIPEPEVLGFARARFNDSGLADLEQLWADEAGIVIEALNNGQIGKPVDPALDSMPNGF